MHKNIMMINATIHIMSLTEKVKSSVAASSSEWGQRDDYMQHTGFLGQ